MTIGQRIKCRRKELGMSVDDVAGKLGKNRATVYRYESNEIKELPCAVLTSLAEVLRTTPADLMGYGNDAELRTDEIELLESYNLLNRDGKAQALERIRELTELQKFRKDTKLLNA